MSQQEYLTVADALAMVSDVTSTLTVLLGSIGSQQASEARPVFTAGAIAGSVSWFLLLGYGARLLVPLFARPRAWQVLDAAVALMLWGIAASLILSA